MLNTDSDDAHVLVADRDWKRPMICYWSSLLLGGERERERGRKKRGTEGGRERWGTEGGEQSEGNRGRKKERGRENGRERKKKERGSYVVMKSFSNAQQDPYENMI